MWRETQKQRNTNSDEEITRVRRRLQLCMLSVWRVPELAVQTEAAEKKVELEERVHPVVKEGEAGEQWVIC